MPKLCDQALERVAVAIFEKENIVDLLNDIGCNMKSWTQSDFIMNAELKKRPGEYSNKNQYGKLVEKCKNANIPVRWGDAISYIKTKDRGYLPLGVTDNFNIDYLYYLKRIAAVVERPLRVSHGFTEKEILELLRGGRVL